MKIRPLCRGNVIVCMPSSDCAHWKSPVRCLRYAVLSQDLLILLQGKKKKKKVTRYLGYSLHWSPYAGWYWWIYFFTPSQQCLGQYHIRQRPDIVHWLKFICILQRAAASAQCFASQALLPKEVLGSGDHERCLNPTPPPQLPPAITATVAVTESRCCKYFWTKTKSIHWTLYVV